MLETFNLLFFLVRERCKKYQFFYNEAIFKYFGAECCNHRQLKFHIHPWLQCCQDCYIFLCFFLISAILKPQISEPLHGAVQMYFANTNNTLHCIATGRPSPMINWLKDGQIINSSRDFHDRYMDQTQSTSYVKVTCLHIPSDRDSFSKQSFIKWVSDLRIAMILNKCLQW